MLETFALPDPQLELMLGVQPEESLEWQAQRNRHYTGWHDVESTEQLVAIVQSITHENDWFTVQTKDLHGQPLGRYAHAANTGHGYLVEVAQINGQTTHNWRIGRGAAADDAGNKPHKSLKASQILSLAAMEGLVSWRHGQGLPLGYGAALRIYRSA
ncbi:hypothetical protein [Arthrobacter sp. UYCu723]